MRDHPIGIYDSGIGGLTILRALQHLLPHENFVYFADTYHLPYGDKSPAEIRSLGRSVVSWMTKTHGVKAVVAACHTSSALANLPELSTLFGLPIIGTILPLAKFLGEKPRNIGILATAACAASRGHELIFRQEGVQGKIITIPCPEFVPLIEAHNRDISKIRENATRYLRPFHDHQLDTLVYGCTHYPLIEGVLRSLLPPTTIFVDPSWSMATDLLTTLGQGNLLTMEKNQGETLFYTSLNPEAFQEKLKRVFDITAPVCGIRPGESWIQTVDQTPHRLDAFQGDPVSLAG